VSDALVNQHVGHSGIPGEQFGKNAVSLGEETLFVSQENTSGNSGFSPKWTAPSLFWGRSQEDAVFYGGFANSFHARSLTQGSCRVKLTAASRRAHSRLTPFVLVG
jgi:hypothetical protein